MDVNRSRPMISRKCMNDCGHSLHVLLIPFSLSQLLVGARVRNGGHDVPASKLAPRYERLWPLVAAATPLWHRVVFYNNAHDEGPHRSRRISFRSHRLPTPMAHVDSRATRRTLRSVAMRSHHAPHVFPARHHLMKARFLNSRAPDCHRSFDLARNVGRTRMPISLPILMPIESSITVLS